MDSILPPRHFASITQRRATANIFPILGGSLALVYVTWIIFIFVNLVRLINAICPEPKQQPQVLLPSQFLQPQLLQAIPIEGRPLDLFPDMPIEMHLASAFLRRSFWDRGWGSVGGTMRPAIREWRWGSVVAAGCCVLEVVDGFQAGIGETFG